VNAARRRLNQWDRRRNLRAAERFPHRIGYHSYNGMPITVVISDPEASAWYDRDWPQVPEVRLLRQGKLRAGGICYIEVHAGCGLEQAGSTVADLLSCFPQDRYRRYAVEPEAQRCGARRRGSRAAAAVRSGRP
jgi:hypothetical protein